jgi:hypothetical protein
MATVSLVIVLFNYELYMTGNSVNKGRTRILIISEEFFAERCGKILVTTNLKTIATRKQL